MSDFYEKFVDEKVKEYLSDNPSIDNSSKLFTQVLNGAGARHDIWNRYVECESFLRNQGFYILQEAIDDNVASAEYLYANCSFADFHDTVCYYVFIKMVRQNKFDKYFK
jgi:hypothetical protein